MIKYIVFDFDGTLVDSRSVILSAYNDLAGHHGLQTIDAERLEALKPLTMLNRLKAMNIPLYKVPALTRDFLARYRQQLEEVSMVEGMADLLRRLNSSGLQSAILSSNTKGAISAFLQHQGIAEVASIFCSTHIFGKDRLLRQFLKKHRLNHSEILYICDESRDLVACRKINVRPVWVSWGFEQREALGPDVPALVAHTPEELWQIIRQECAPASAPVSG
jgi:phosphoglycolate phosphatase